MARGIQPTTKFGWCMQHAENHAACRVEYVDWNGKEQRCGCACHAEPEPKKRKTSKPR